MHVTTDIYKTRLFAHLSHKQKLNYQKCNKSRNQKSLIYDVSVHDIADVTILSLWTDN